MSRKRQREGAHARYQEREAKRQQVQGEWEAKGLDNKEEHFYMQENAAMINPVYVAGHELRVVGWENSHTNQLYPWLDPADGPVPPGHLFNRGAIPGNVRASVNDIKALPGIQRNITPYRQAENQELRNAAAYYEQVTGEVSLTGTGREALWAFGGMDNGLAYGPAWSCFKYIISDLYTGGIVTGSQLMLVVMMCAQDIVSLTYGTQNSRGITDYSDSSCLVFFEGRTDPDNPQGGPRKILYLGEHQALSLGDIIEDPSPLFETLIAASNSESLEEEEKGGNLGASGMLFQRLYFNVLTDLVGNSLKDMPAYMKKLREGMKYKGVKGYHLIPDNTDNSCGLEAIVWALSNIFLRIKKMLKAAEKAIPSLCDKFENFRKRVYEKGNKGKKQKELLKRMKIELGRYVGWKKGQSLSHDQLCEMVSKYAEFHQLDLGIIIFDAISPLTNYHLSYDNKEGMPKEIICLVHWNYPALSSANVDVNVPSGHYDCIDQTNVTKWLTMRNPKAYTKNTRFSFRSISLINGTQADDKGDWCDLCKTWQGDIENDKWISTHNPSQSHNRVVCDDCHVRFRSQSCFGNHRERRHGHALSACESRLLCDVCDRVHDRTYDCSRFYCGVCFGTFDRSEKRTHVCYLSYSSDKKKVRVKTVIYADMEGTRNGEQAGVHEAVCLAACWSTICEDHNQLREEHTKEKKRCKDCHSHCDNWGWFCDGCLAENEIELSNDCKQCSRKRTKYFLGHTCVDDFLDWVMNYHLGSTVVFHNGGKYDLHILVPAILKSDKYYIVNDANRSTQIIYMSVGLIDGDDPIAETTKKKNSSRYVHFKDSLNFIQSSLRNFNDMFHLGSTDKGRFPYDLLNVKGWEDWDGLCPGPEYFGITEKELKYLSNLSNNRQREIKEILEYIDIENKSGKSWNALEKIKHYTMMDVEVLHDGCEIFRKEFWDLLGHDPFNYVTLPQAVAGAYRQPEFMRFQVEDKTSGKVRSEAIQIFKIPDREWQHLGLRGGRCEAFKMYWKKTKPSERFIWVDVNSEYPWAQAYGYYPVGAMTLELKYQNFVAYSVISKTFFEKTGVLLEDVLMDPSGKTGCGLIECEYRCATDVFIPVIPSRVKFEDRDRGGTYLKNVFQNKTGSCVLFMTVLAEAIKANQVIVLSIKRLQFWKNTSDKLFKNFICKLYGAKVEASGWNKSLNKKNPTEEEKLDFIEESKKRGINLNKEKMEDNPGKRTTAKLAANCGWGYLSKKLSTGQHHYFDNYQRDHVDNMEDLMVRISKVQDIKMVGQPVGVGRYTKIRTTKPASEVTVKEMDKKVAYHVGGQVPAYGLQKMTRGLLSLHPSQPCYGDTDSIGYIYDSENKEHTMIECDNYLGGWSEEYPDYDIVEYVSTGCKSYFVKLVNLKDPEKIIYKGKFKGLPFSSAAFTLTDKNKEHAKLGIEEMKNLTFNAINRIRQANEEKEDLGLPGEDSVDELTYKFEYTNFFKRGADYKIRATNEKKTVRFTYDKRKIVLPSDLKDGWENRVKEINTEPLTDYSSEWRRDKVAKWWKERRELMYKLYLNKDKTS